MKRFLLYLFPALIDMLVGSFFFVAPVRMAESGAGAFAVSMLISLWGLCYMVGSFLVGRAVSERNCRPMMIGGCLGVAACSAAFIAAPQLGFMYVIMACFGTSVAFFFPPYQVFMRGVERDDNRHVASSTAIYTASWSAGLAAGPFAASIIWSLSSWQWACAFDIFLALATLAGLLVFFRLAKNSPPARSPQPAAAQSGSQQAAQPPDLAWLAWIGTGAALMAMSMVRGVFPVTSHGYGIDKSGQGITLALVCVGQSVIALALIKGRTWFYRPAPVAAFGLAGIAGLVLFGLARTAPVYHAAAFCVGIYGGAAFIYMVFHALVHPSKSGRYAGINEAIVGLTGIIGPALAGVLAERAGFSIPYYVAAGIVGVAVIFQVFAHNKSRAF